MRNHLECAIATAGDGARHVERVSASVAAMESRVQRVLAIVNAINASHHAPSIRAQAARALQQIEELTRRIVAVAQDGAAASQHLRQDAEHVAALAERIDVAAGGARPVDDVPAALRAAIRPIVGRVLRGRFAGNPST